MSYNDRVGFEKPQRALCDLSEEEQREVYAFLYDQDADTMMSSFGAHDIPQCISECELVRALMDAKAEDDVTVGEFRKKHAPKLLPLAVA